MDEASSPGQGIVRLFEGLSPADVADLGRHYAHGAYFKDPFNEVRGLAAIQRIFAHMFESLEAPRFKVLSLLEQDGQAFVTWDFEFGLRGRALKVHGASHLRFAPDGRVNYHHDYWDAAEQVYERVPLLGGLLRLLRRRLAAR